MKRRSDGWFALTKPDLIAVLVADGYERYTAATMKGNLSKAQLVREIEGRRTNVFSVLHTKIVEVNSLQREVHSLQRKVHSLQVSAASDALKMCLAADEA